MSNETDIYDKIRVAIPLLSGFSDKTEIPYPYDLSEQNINFLREGWAVKVGSSTPRTATDNTEYTMVTEFEIVLTERVATTASNADPLITITKRLRNDLSTIQDDFTASPMTTSTRFSHVDKIEYIDVVSISGVENVTSGKFNHITTSITFGFTHWK